MYAYLLSHHCPPLQWTANGPLTLPAPRLVVVELRPGLATTLRPRMAARLVRERRAKRAMSKLVQVPREEVGVHMFYLLSLLILHTSLTQSLTLSLNHIHRPFAISDRFVIMFLYDPIVGRFLLLPLDVSLHPMLADCQMTRVLSPCGPMRKTTARSGNSTERCDLVPWCSQIMSPMHRPATGCTT